ncbi:MAG TPA: 50S ribosomal protein L29 [bacterium]|nr:50S ribosomal protein L29 [bacterium]HPQ18521.1 50S ribosomal protein L29 [bacterium]
MKANELRNKTNEELLQLLNTLEEDLYNMRFQKTISSVPNPKKHFYIRKDIARIKTILNERKEQK